MKEGGGGMCAQVLLWGPGGSKYEGGGADTGCGGAGGTRSERVQTRRLGECVCVCVGGGGCTGVVVGGVDVSCLRRGGAVTVCGGASGTGSEGVQARRPGEWQG